ncbi:plasma kallikrein-like [Bradysia coprophila]|uniref:plasma kallikrein-like n=1 Tax=Bradysia coprophila TaxID=38358 RepID=UPI00187D8C48|nr:plasma kallikrein-like [Bradysia coprophila]
MRGIIFLLCLYCVQASGADWLNRTIRVDFVVDREVFHAFHDQNDFPRESPINDRRGINATNGQFPWTIFTRARSPTQGALCTGTIISDSYFLSDLRCLGQQMIPPANSMGIYIGSNEVDWRDSPTNFVRHSWYIAPSAQNSPNIALCRIDEPLTFNPNVQPIRLPYTSNTNFSYEAWSSLLLGYELTANNNRFFDQLRSVPNKILHNDQCNFLGRIDEHEMCGLTDVTPYDNEFTPIRFSIFTGGAWMVNEYAADLNLHPVLIGIHHYQFFNGTEDTFGRATRVSHFLEWISTLTDGDTNK